MQAAPHHLRWPTTRARLVEGSSEVNPAACQPGSSAAAAVTIVEALRAKVRCSPTVGAGSRACTTSATRWGRTARPGRRRAGTPSSTSSLLAASAKRRRPADVGGRFRAPAAAVPRPSADRPSGRGCPPGSARSVAPAAPSSSPYGRSASVRAETASLSRSGARRTRVPQHRDQRHHPGSRRRRRPRGWSPSQTNQPPIGPRTSSSSPGSTTSARNAGHLAVLEPLDVQLDQRVRRRRGDRVRPLRDVAVVGGQPDHVVLAGQVVDPVRDVQPQHAPRGVGWLTSTVDGPRRSPAAAGRELRRGPATRLSHPGSAVPATGRPGRGSRCAPRIPARRAPAASAG